MPHWLILKLSCQDIIVFSGTMEHRNSSSWVSHRLASSKEAIGYESAKNSKKNQVRDHTCGGRYESQGQHYSCPNCDQGVKADQVLRHQRRPPPSTPKGPPTPRFVWIYIVFTSAASQVNSIFYLYTLDKRFMSHDFFLFST